METGHKVRKLWQLQDGCSVFSRGFFLETRIDQLGVQLLLKSLNIFCQPSMWEACHCWSQKNCVQKLASVWPLCTFLHWLGITYDWREQCASLISNKDTGRNSSKRPSSTSNLTGARQILKSSEDPRRSTATLLNFYLSHLWISFRGNWGPIIMPFQILCFGRFFCWQDQPFSLSNCAVFASHRRNATMCWSISHLFSANLWIVSMCWSTASFLKPN